MSGRGRAPGGVPRGGRWHGGPVGEFAECVLAPNPGPLTLDGTNTWVLGRPGAAEVLVVDPGPAQQPHLRAVLDTVHRRDARVAAVLLTHAHLDHSAGARWFAELARAPVRALDPGHRVGGQGLGPGDVVAIDGLRVRVEATPGHSADSLCFVLSEARAVLTGDTVLGRGTTVVAHPEGRLADYLASLERLAEVARAEALDLVLPGHGPALGDPQTVLASYLTHRRERLAQVRAARDAGATTARSVVARVYAEVDPALWPAAELSVRAQLEYLATVPEEGYPPRG